ncbi:hypothetical protein TKV_c18200 [Thermoanaerobacter kivui]|uniref:Uncharacterized protein n=1 Tax=Thermoanaerobacter kivui TaxID=2325 RepID=A0A097AT07_THEKI|nr:hypothetical protein [Thermoanaerobacter kivui]AIS52970.1 hypothetical protein TKV_c18200 [Thermoanaerobacter kivui]
MQPDEVRVLREQLKKVKKNPLEVSQFLKKVLKKQKDIVLIITILELFNETTYLYHVLFKRKTILNSLKYIDKKAEKILEAIKSLVNNAKYYSDMEVKIKNNIENEIKGYKEYFESIIDVLYGYYVESRYVNDVINDKARDFFVADSIDEEEFYKSVQEFINEVEEEKEERIQEIISSIPFAMSKKRFYEYLTKGLERNYSSYESLLESVIDIEENFYGKLIEGYGEIFPGIAERIEYLQSLDFKNMSKEKVDAYLKESIELIKIVQNLREISFSVLKIINRLLIIFLSQVKFKEAIKEEPFIAEFMDFYSELTKVSLNYKEVESRTKKCDNVISNWYFELYRYNVLLGEVDYSNLDIMEIVDEGILTDIEELSEYENLINDASEIVLEKGEIEEEPIDMSIVRGEIKNIISLIEAISRNMKNDYRKARMKRLMGIIPVPENFEKEILNYVRNSLEFDNSENKKASFMQTVKKRMELYKDLKNQKKFYESIIKNAQGVI